MRNDVKVKGLRQKFSHTGYAVWNYLLETLTNNDFFEIIWDEANITLLAADYDITESELVEIVEYCLTVGLLQRADNKLFCNALNSEFSRLLSRRKRERERIAQSPTEQQQEEAVLAAKTPVLAAKTPILAAKTPETEESTTPLDSSLSSLSLSPIPPISNSIFPPLSPQEKKEEKTRIINNSCEKETKKNSIFRRPTVEQVAEYCEARGNNVDAAVFCDFYESKGWVVGRSPMKDWKAAVRTWERTGGTDRGGGYMRPYRRESVTESIIRASRECDEMMRAEMEAAMADKTKIDEQ